MRRLLWLTPVPFESAGSRFRIYQHLPGLEAAGIRCDVRPFFDRKLFGVAYERGRTLEKLARVTLAAVRRLRDVLSVGQYDALVVYRETLPIGGALIERWTKARGVRLIYDLDDAVYLRDEVTVNPLARRLRVPKRVFDVVRRSDLVLCGSEYLASQCRPFNDRVVIVPTSVDVEHFKPRPLHTATGADAVIAWVGSHSSSIYLDMLDEPLRRVSARWPAVFEVIGAGSPRQVPGVRVRNRRWRLEEEVSYFQSADIGVYPVRDSEWGRGKCAFKAIQFMAVGAAVVASPVGASLELITDGENGLFARTDREWEQGIETLLCDPWLRQRMGEAARKTVEERYSLQAVGPRLVAAFKEVLNR